MDYTVHGILHARMLEWVAVPFSRGYPPGVKLESVSPALAGGFFTTSATACGSVQISPFYNKSSRTELRTTILSMGLPLWLRL